MNQIEHRLRLDVLKENVQGIIRISQNDTKLRELIITIMTGSQAYPLWNIDKAILKAKKPDGSVLLNECEVDNTTVSYAITRQTSAAVGDVECELILYAADGGIVATPKFKIIVAQGVYPDSQIESTSEYTALQKAILEAAGKISVVVSGSATVIPTVAQMKAKQGLESGDIVSTAGFYSAGDGGGAQYEIVSSATADGYFVHKLANGLYAKLLAADDTLNMLQIGAKGDGVFDNSDHFEAAGNLAYQNIYLPKGTYIVAPRMFAKYAESDKINQRFGKVAFYMDKDNMSLYGDGQNQTVIKVAGGITDRYCAVISVLSSNCTIRDLTIDQNTQASPMIPEPLSGKLTNDPPYMADGSEYNPAIHQAADIPQNPDGSYQYPHSRDMHKLHCILSGRGISGLIVSGCGFIHYGSQAVIVGPNKSCVRNCDFLYDPACRTNDPSTVNLERTAGPAYDISTVYINGNDVQILNNTFRSTILPGQYEVDNYVVYNGGSPTFDSGNVSDTATGTILLAATTAIENHGANCVITGNAISDYLAGVILSNMGSTDGSASVSGNTMTRVCSGIKFWPWDAYPLKNVRVSDNHVSLTFGWYVEGAQNCQATSYGVGVSAGCLVDCTVTNNYIAFDTASMTEDAQTYGVGPCAGVSTLFAQNLTNFQVTGNYILSSPSYGIYLHPYSAPSMDSATVHGNTLVDCGWCDYQLAALSTNTLKNNISRRAAIEVSFGSSSADIKYFVIANNVIIDNSEGGACGHGILVGKPAWITDGKLEIRGNIFKSRSGAGWATGTLSQTSISQIPDNTSQFEHTVYLSAKPNNMVMKEGQVFFGRDPDNSNIIGWKCTKGGGYNRVINAASGSLFIHTSDSGAYTTILTMPNAAHGIRVGDGITVTYGDVSNSMIVMLVNGEKIYLNDWRVGGQYVTYSEPVNVTVAVRNGAEITPMAVSGAPGGPAEYAGTFDIPGTIPDGTAVIGSYTASGGTGAAGSITIGDQTIDLPAIGKWDILRCTASGKGTIESYTSAPLSLSAVGTTLNDWGKVTESDEWLHIRTTNYLLPVPTPIDESLPPACLACETLTVRSIVDMLKEDTTEGISLKANGQIRVKIPKATLTAAGYTGDLGGWLSYLSSPGVQVTYQTVEPVSTESAAVDPLIECAGDVVLSGYASGTMTAMTLQEAIAHAGSD